MTLSYNPRQKSLRQYCNIHIFLSFLGSLLKQCILFEIFLQFSLPQPYTELKLGKKFWMHASNIVCGVRGGVGPVWIGKRPRNAKVSQDFCPWFYVLGHYGTESYGKTDKKHVQLCCKMSWRATTHVSPHMFNLSYNCCKTHEYDFWLDKITRKSRQTGGLQHFLKKKFALSR